MLTKGVRGNPSQATLVELNQTVDSLRLQPHGTSITPAQD